MRQVVPISTDFIKLDALLKLAGVCDTGGQAKIAILEGDVSVNGTQCVARGTKLRRGDTVTLEGVTLVIA